MNHIGYIYDITDASTKHGMPLYTTEASNSSSSDEVVGRRYILVKVGVVEEHVRCKTSNIFSVIVAKSNSQTPSRYWNVERYLIDRISLLHEFPST
mgnify:CR=1 FL=1